MKSAPEQLGLRPGDAGVLRGVPDPLHVLLGPLPEGPAPRRPLATCGYTADVARAAAALLPLYAPGRLVWFAWTALSRPLRSDISRDRGWEPLQEAGFLGVAQVSLDAAWSALRVRPCAEGRRITRAGG